MKFTSLSFVVVLAALATACGGGANPNGPDTTPPTTTPSAGPLSLLSANPTSGTMVPTNTDRIRVIVQYDPQLLNGQNGDVFIASYLSVDGQSLITDNSQKERVNGSTPTVNQTLALGTGSFTSGVTRTSHIVVRMERREGNQFIEIARAAFPHNFTFCASGTPSCN